ncbi:MAG: Uma2 family endonuclease, partial [Pyrinomonadaceae bacterium]
MSENHTHRLTTDDLVAIPEDGNWYELIDGQIVRSEHPLLSHQRILDNLIYRFGVVPKNERNCSFWSNVGVIFDRHNSVIPDFVFVRKDRKAEIASGEYITGTPDLIVEILSLGTENIERDRILKLQAYESFGLPEYWIVDPFNRLV